MMTLAKNNLKLMLRSKWIILFYLFAPLIIIGALTNAFKGLLDNGYNLEDLKIGYELRDENYREICDEMIAYVSDFMSFAEYNDGTPEQIIQDSKLDAFVVIDDKVLTVYSASPNSLKTRVITWMMSNIPYAVSNATLVNQTETQPNNQPTVGELPYKKTATSAEYYGIIEIVYFLAMNMLFLGVVIQSEKKGRIIKKYQTTPISGLGLYLGKFIPCQIIAGACSIGATLLATFLFDIHWGNIHGTIGILTLTSLASTAFGVALLMIFDKLATAIILMFSLAWIAGFVGGSFECYIYTATPESIRVLSPIYHVNRTLVEFLTDGRSDYTVSAVIYQLAIIAVCSTLGIAFSNKKKEEK